MRFKRKRNRVSFLRRRYFWIGTALLSVLVFLFHAVVFSPWLEIQEVRVTGTEELSPEHIVAAVEQNFWQSFFGIPQNSMVLVHARALESVLSETFPRISRVAVRRSFPQTLAVEITEREQVATWCRDDACVALDVLGIPFKEVKDEGTHVLLRSKSSLVLGKELLDPSTLSLLLEFKEAFEKAPEQVRVSVTAFEIGERNQVEGVAAPGWRILLDLNEDIIWQQTKLHIVLEQKVPLEQRGNLEYIDLRFGDQAFVKYQD